MRSDSPLKYIPELESIPEIRSFQDILTVRDFVYELIPWTNNPQDGLTLETVLELYKKFKEKLTGGWCGTNAEYFQLIMKWYDVRTRPYNFGIVSHKITHVGIVVTYDGSEFFMDPYLGVHYNHRDGFPLTFQALLELIANRKLDRIISIYSNRLKPVKTYNGWQMMTPQQMISSILATWPDYEKIMKEIFGETSPLLLMQLKIPE